MYERTQQIVLEMALKGYTVRFSSHQDEIEIHIKRADDRKMSKSEERDVFVKVCDAINADMLEAYQRHNNASAIVSNWRTQNPEIVAAAKTLDDKK